jgi:RHH-type proline utilization regulon transcriptional repressor/proline dehydrogenase/delta 1-pyrroline-5-carboxylate dehydrogenase
MEKIEAGNLYINRVTTGAVVLRQSFGGMGLSAIGAGIKAGSPNYAVQFCKIEESEAPTQGPLREESPCNAHLHFIARNWQNQLSLSTDSTPKIPVEIRHDLQKTIQAIYSCLFQFEKEFSGEQDFSVYADRTTCSVTCRSAMLLCVCTPTIAFLKR